MALDERTEAVRASQKLLVPGRAGCRLEYDVHEQVVRVDVLDKVKEAKRAVLDEYSPDALGLKPKEWNQSVIIVNNRNKFTVENSDKKLSNTVLPSNINPKDYRTLSGPTYTFDKTTKAKFFDRGEVTTGWNHSTVQDLKERTKQLGTFDQTCKTQTAKRTGQLSNYLTPIQQQEQIIDQVRKAKSELGKDDRVLEQKYGVEGAEHMRYILSLKSPNHIPRIRTTKADLLAVADLPGDDKDEGQEEDGHQLTADYSEY